MTELIAAASHLQPRIGSQRELEVHLASLPPERAAYVRLLSVQSASPKTGMLIHRPPPFTVSSR